ncbi:Methionyl-tRNA formyltransferase [Neolecta irregularis DAH-3]|uniref:Methionyl-tRNA formyltransferase n=1 Tax=Neolecta irregularis (strain DAH-3) TaxID=1198029 RepID=A0A1U7LWJ6_NEOID|nr:Methionyl-tRNA formyltransferase [Neolecta irregularis DAH-3]|eukprot:OLL26881.1 Methionyl-tRNA formyltransferase [Neolecta irregularis DAH-3]
MAASMSIHRSFQGILASSSAFIDLPRFYGPAPIHHALLSGDTTTGVTVQSLHPTKFDQGKILARSEEIPISTTSTYDLLYKRLADVGADLLLNVLQSRTFESEGLLPIHEAKYAPKVSKEDQVIKWDEWDIKTFNRHAQAFRNLYCHLGCQNLRMFKLSGFEISHLQQDDIGSHEPGSFRHRNREMVISLNDGEVVVKNVQPEGKTWVAGCDWVRGWHGGAGGVFT